MPRYITRRALQRVLRAHLMTVHYWTKSPDFPRPQKAIGRTYLYDADAVYEWLTRHDKADEWDIGELRAWEVK